MDEPGKLCVRLRRVRENIRAEVAGELLTADVSAKFEARLGEDRVQDSLVAVPTIVVTELYLLLWIFFIITIFSFTILFFNLPRDLYSIIQLFCQIVLKSAQFPKLTCPKTFLNLYNPGLNNVNYIEDDKPGWQMQEDHKLGLAAPVPAHPVPGQLPHPQLRLSPGGEGRVVLTGGPFSIQFYTVT